MVSLVAFAPEDRWVIVRNNNVCWDRDLVDDAYELLERRYGTGQGSPLVALDFGPDGEYAAFAQSGDWWADHKPLVKHLKKEYDGEEVKLVSLGATRHGEATYILATSDGSLSWSSHAPRRFDQLLKTRCNRDVTWAALGASGSWFLKFDDGSWYWDRLHSDLEEILDDEEARGRGVAKVFLSASTRSTWYVEYSDGTAEWSAPASFSNELNMSRYLAVKNILFSVDSIADHFSCGRSLDEVIQELREGHLDPEDVPAMRVCTYQGQRYSLNNRRNFVFGEARVKKVPIIWVQLPRWLKSKVDRGFDGRSVRIQQS